MDTREESEWARGHIPSAIHLGKGIIERDIEKTIPDKDATVVLYCGGGFRSALAADNLQKMGYQQRDFDGRRLARLDRSRIPDYERLPLGRNPRRIEMTEFREFDAPLWREHEAAKSRLEKLRDEAQRLGKEFEEKFAPEIADAEVELTRLSALLGKIGL